MKKTTKLILAIIVCLLTLLGCTKNSEKKIYDSYDELDGEKVGTVLGTVFVGEVKNVFPNSEYVYYNSISDAITGLKEGKVESFFIDYGIAVQTCQLNDDLTFFNKSFGEFEYGMIFADSEKGNALRSEFNTFLQEEYADYDFESSYREWANAKEYELYDYENLSAENGIIKIATDSQAFPFIFMSNNQLTGLEIELLYNFCLKNGYGLEADLYDFAGVLAAVSSGKADIGVDGLCYTEERAQSFNFSNLYAKSGGVILVRKDNLSSKIQNISDLSNTKVSCVSGSVYQSFLEEKVDGITYQYFDTCADMVNSLIQGKASAAIINSNIYEAIKADYENIRVVDSIYTDNIGYVLPKSEEESLLQTQINTFINKLKDSGELEEINDMWLNDYEGLSVDYSDLEPINGTIKFAVSSGEGAPSNYIKDGKYCGLEIDILVRFAREYGYDIEFQDYSFSGVLVAVSSGKADIGAGCITITEERAKSINFSIPYNSSYVYVITYDQNVSTNEKSLIEKLSDSFNKTFIIEERYKLFLSGIATTMLITLSACLLGTLLGFMLYFLFRNCGKVCATLLNAYSWIIAGLPTVVLLMIFYYVIFAKTNLSAIFISIIVFAILFSLSVFSILKTCFMAVDKGQFEAGYALGYSKAKTITNIIIPEIAPMFFPSYRGEIVSLIKATSIVGYIAVQDLTKASDIVRSRTYEAFFPLIVITIIYFLLALILDLISRFIEKRVNTRNRKVENIMKGVKTK